MIETLHPQEHRPASLIAAAPTNILDNAINALTMKPKLPLITTDFSATKTAEDTNDQLSIAPTPVLSSDRVDVSLSDSPQNAPCAPANPPELSANLAEFHQGVDALLLLAACASSAPKKQRKSQGGGRKRALDSHCAANSLSDADTDAAHSSSPTPPPATKRARSKDAAEAPDNADAPVGLEQLSSAAASEGSASAGPSRGSYKCGRCGQPKKGHVCTMPAPAGGEDGAADGEGKSSGRARAGKGGGKGRQRASAEGVAAEEERASGAAPAGSQDAADAPSPSKRAASVLGSKPGAVPSNMVCALFLAGCSTAPIPHRPAAAAPGC